VSDAAVAELAKVGFDPVFGARPLKRAIQQRIENPLSKLLLEGKFSPQRHHQRGCGPDSGAGAVQLFVICDTRAMRIVGTSRAGADDAPVNPQEAWARGRVLDAMLPSVVLVPRGVSRLTHEQRNAMDDARMVEVARRLNTPRNTSGAS
jgi:hypothetical protein